MKQYRLLSVACALIMGTALLQARAIDYPKVIDSFVGTSDFYTVKPFMDYVKLIEIKAEGEHDAEPYRFFGVHEKDQLKVNFEEFKKKIASLMGVEPNNVIQIIGDSVKYKESDVPKIRKFLRDEMDKAHMVEYGFTGSKDGYDINSFVNEYVDDDPAIAHKTLGNLVAQTDDALKYWGKYGSPEVRYRVVVYNNYDMSHKPEYHEGKKISGYTTFGNDIVMSDHFLQPHDGDTFVCVGGGVQSFIQLTNALQLNVPITLVEALGTPDRQKYFSATHFLKLVNDAYAKNKNLSEAEVQEIFDTYFKTLENISDPNRTDFKTKKELFDTAMKRFIDGGLYKKVHELSTFHDVDDM